MHELTVFRPVRFTAIEAVVNANVINARATAIRVLIPHRIPQGWWTGLTGFRMKPGESNPVNPVEKGAGTSVNSWRLQPVETEHPGLAVDGGQGAAAAQDQRSFRDNAKPGRARAPRPP